MEMTDRLVSGALARGSSVVAAGRVGGGRIGLPLMVAAFIGLLAISRARCEPRFRELGLVVGG